MSQLRVIVVAALIAGKWSLALEIKNNNRERKSKRFLILIWGKGGAIREIIFSNQVRMR